MDANNQQQSAQGTGLQNTTQLQQGRQDSLQPQNNYKQLQQNALGSDAYRNFDGLRVQEGVPGQLKMSMPTHSRTTLNAWPSAGVFTLAVIAFIVYVNFKNTVTPHIAAGAKEEKTKEAATEPAVTKNTKKPKAKKTATKVVKKKKSSKKSKR